ncbi:PIN domain-containing protein [Microbulbifer hainanensis]|uniref:hypothetical protein n=1 Tax=Microbulbifer hainanensis TaxID=2735675 RepID=UPI001868AEDF|nr:hypothetical protein [Microbulbifer hainanensis]
MTIIWIDAYASSVVIREALFCAAERAQTETTLTDNQPMWGRPSRVIGWVPVTMGFGVVDNGKRHA